MRSAVLIAALGMMLAACRYSRPRTAEIDSDLAKFIPSDTLVLVETRLDALQETPVYRKYLAAQTLPQFDEFARATGIDPHKDVSVLLYCSDGKRGVLLGRGRFNPSDAEAKLAARGARRLDYKNHRLMGDEHNAVVFVSSTIAMAGSTTVLRGILDRGGHGDPPPWLAALVHTIPTSSQIWAAFGGRGLAQAFPDDGNLSNLNRIARSVESGVVYADLRQGIDLAADGTCSTEEDARQIHDALVGLIGMGRLTTPSNRPEMLRLYDNIQVNQEQKILHIRANVPLDLVDPFFKMFGK